MGGRVKHEHLAFNYYSSVEPRSFLIIQYITLFMTGTILSPFTLVNHIKHQETARVENVRAGSVIEGCCVIQIMAKY